MNRRRAATITSVGDNVNIPDQNRNETFHEKSPEEDGEDSYKDISPPGGYPIDGDQTKMDRVQHREALRRFCKDQALSIKHIKGPIFKKENDFDPDAPCWTSQYYAYCKKHKRKLVPGDPEGTVLCNFAVKAEVKQGDTNMLIMQRGSCADAVAKPRRADAEHPMSLELYERISERLRLVGATQIDPLTLLQWARDQDLGPVDGASVQNLIKKAIQRDKGESAIKDASVEGLQEWAQARRCRLDVPSDDFEWPSDSATTLIVPFLGEGVDQRMPTINQGGVFMAFACVAFIVHAFEVAGDRAAQGFIGQMDFMHKIVWQAYTLGVLGLKIYQWAEDKEWRKLFVPIVGIFTPTESTQAYALLMEIGTLLLQHAAHKRNIHLNAAVFKQMHTDFHKSAALAISAYANAGTSTTWSTCSGTCAISKLRVLRLLVISSLRSSLPTWRSQRICQPRQHFIYSGTPCLDT
jgi:hypothetical protein